MKRQLLLLLATIICGAHLHAQTTRAIPLTEKTVVPNPNLQKLELEDKKKNVPPPAPPTNIQTASISILNGDDGKDNDTFVSVDFLDQNKRVAANYNDAPNNPGSIFPGRPNDVYYAGSTISLPMKTESSVPTGQMTNAGGLPIPVLRYATEGDFSNGGEVKITIDPNGHDTWKIQTFSVVVSFQNDTRSPHRMTWSNIVLSQDGRVRELLFDKNFNPL